MVNTASGPCLATSDRGNFRPADQHRTGPWERERSSHYRKSAGRTPAYPWGTASKSPAGGTQNQARNFWTLERWTRWFLPRVSKKRLAGAGRSGRPEARIIVLLKDGEFGKASLAALNRLVREAGGAGPSGRYSARSPPTTEQSFRYYQGLEKSLPPLRGENAYLQSAIRTLHTTAGER